MTSWREDDKVMERRFVEALQVWLKGDQAAIRFAIDVVCVAHLWDDLIDRDRERTNEEISAVFKICLFDLLANPFYARNIGELRPIMVNAYLGWHASNVIHDKAKQWFLKASIYNIIVHCAYLVGGMEWAERMTPEIWGFYEEVYHA